MSPKDPQRIGVVPYLNARPLTEGLDGVPGIEVVSAVPSRLSTLLASREIDVATLPIVDAGADPDYRVLPGIGIGSRGPARSVRLFHRGPISSLRSVALDPASRTSVVLLRILLEVLHGVRPEYLPGPPGDGEADGTLLIGDACLFEEDGGRRVLDLGEAWTSWTSLPFVYAVWVGRGRLEAIRQPLLEARERGLASISRIAAEAGRSLGREPGGIESYLREAMRYDLGDEEGKAVDLYFRRAAEIGALPKGRSLRFLEAGAR